MTYPWRRAAAGAHLLNRNGDLAPTIFDEITQLATRHTAINLGQGFPDEDGPAAVLQAAAAAIGEGVNQYAPGSGLPVLREAVAAHQRRFYGLSPDPDTEVLITTGATEGLAAALLAFTGPGDEVITFDPCYDAYGAVIGLSGARQVSVPLRRPDFLPDDGELQRAFTARTRAVVVNSPHNPTGSVFGEDLLDRIVELAVRHDCVIVTDEVYEHLTFGHPHIPVATRAGAADRTLSVSSAGKTFSVTGWKVGWLTGPAALVGAVRAVKQFLTYSSGPAFQVGAAVGLALGDGFFGSLGESLRIRRDLLMDGLTAAGLDVFEPYGTYFVMADAAPLGIADASALARILPERLGVAAIPVGAFCGPQTLPEMRSLLRFTFCKRAEVLEEAVQRLTPLGRMAAEGRLA